MAVTLKSALQEDRVLRIFGLGQLCHPKIIEMIGMLGGFDAVWLDHEHAGLTTPRLEEATRAARAVGLDSFVRLNGTDYATVMRVLEAGASGMMISMVRNVQQVRDLVRWTKFHPLGERGVNGSGVDGRYGMMPFSEYFPRANEQTLLGVQIEHKDAVEVIDEIVAVPQIDFLFIGPADLSQSLGIPAEWEHPRLWQAIERVAQACAKAGRHWAMLPTSPAAARRAVQLGCKILSLGMDIWLIRLGLRAFQEEYVEFFGGERSSS